jgi:hypothetical protein
MRTLPRFPAAAAFLLVALLAAPALADSSRAIEVSARAFDRFALTGEETGFGELEFRGGLVLSSPDRDFGALSGLAVDRDGSLLAVADNGFWFSARLVEKDGALTGIGDARLAPILDARGNPRRTKRAADAEGLRVTVANGKSTAIVVFEQAREVSRFSLDDGLAAAVAKPMKLPDSARNLRSTRGFETVALAPRASALDGAIVIVAEHALDADGNHRGWIVGGPRAGTFSIRRLGDFDITDGEFLPDGDLVILERLFSMTEGVGVRIRRIPADRIAPGKTADGPVIMTAGLESHRIDNMEGLSIRREADGSLSVFIVSDDNQSFVQQTLLLKFSWPAHRTQ